MNAIEMNQSVTQEQQSEAIDWTSDCMGLTGDQKVGAGFAYVYVTQNYPGGWDAFVAECCTEARPAEPQKTLAVERELRGSSHWVHVTGPEAMFNRATYACGVEARKWARELGKARAFRVSGGASFNGPESGGQGTFRYSVSYGFDD